MVNMPAAVRGTSAGALKSGGKANVAIKVIAVVTPIEAEQTMIHSVDGTNISPRKETNRIGPKIRNGHACRCTRSAIVSKMIGVTICAPLSQASGLFQSGHHSPPIAALVTPRESVFGLNA